MTAQTRIVSFYLLLLCRNTSCISPKVGEMSLLHTLAKSFRPPISPSPITYVVEGCDFWKTEKLLITSPLRTHQPTNVFVGGGEGVYPLHP